MVEHRHDRRLQTDLSVRIGGRGRKRQSVRGNHRGKYISGGGALLSGMAREVKPGDVVWVEYHNRKVRFRVVWLSAPAMGQEIRAAVERLENKECPGLR